MMGCKSISTFKRVLAKFIKAIALNYSTALNHATFGILFLQVTSLSPWELKSWR